MSLTHPKPAPSLRGLLLARTRERLPESVRDWLPKSRLGFSVFRALPHLPPDLAAEIVERLQSVVVVESSLAVQVRRQWADYLAGRIPLSAVLIEDHGIVSRKVVTTAGVNFIVDAFQNLTEIENFKYHSLGTGSTAEAVGDTALVTELTTEYNPDNTRATGTTTEGASANIFRSVGTNTLDGTPGAALREHGIHSAASAGTLLDRSVYAAITLSSGDGFTTTYDFTVTAGG